MRNNAATFDVPVPSTGGVRSSSLARARKITEWLDYRFLDPIIGLVLPGVGDVVTAVAGLYLVGVAIRRRLPRIVIARMLINLAVDSLLGAIPIIGDGFDLAFRANKRNLALLERNHARRGPRLSDLAIVGAAAAILLLALLLPVMALWSLYTAVL